MRIRGVACSLGALATTVAVTARAYDYGTPIVETVADVEELVAGGDLEPDEAETLAELLDHPLDVNRADQGGLYELPEVNRELAAAVVEHRLRNGPFTSPRDLLRVPGLTESVLESILPFIVAAGAEARSGGEVDTRSSPAFSTAALAAIWRLRAGQDDDASRPAQSSRDGSPSRSGSSPSSNSGRSGPQGYLRLRANSYGLSAGLLATYRPVMRTWWDFGRGQLVTAGEANELALEGAYLAGGHGPLNALVGSYDVGFADRLTFASTSGSHAGRWSESDRVAVDGKGGSVRAHGALFGAVASLDGVDVGPGSANVTLFASRRNLDAYQYRGIWYAYDDDASPACSRDSDCRAGYSCDRSRHLCHSSQVYDARSPVIDPATGELVPGYRYATFHDAFREVLLGGNMTLSFGDPSTRSNAQLGLTAYWGTTEILLARQARPRFASSSPYPAGRGFGAVGVSGRAQSGSVVVAGEYAYAGSGGHALYARAVLHHALIGEATLALRYYDARFVNPHTRADCEPDLEGGLAARNEIGARMTSTLSPWRELRFYTDADLWRAAQRPNRSGQAGPDWHWTWRLPWSLRLRERVSYHPTRHETLYLAVQYTNKDLTANSRRETYEGESSDSTAGDDEGESSDATDPDAEGGPSAKARGERRAIQVGGRSSRIPRLRLAASAGVVATDTKRLENRFDYVQTLQLRARLRAWPGANLAAGLSLRWHAGDPGDAAQSDGGRASYDVFAEIEQSFFPWLGVRLHYELTMCGDDSSSHRALCHVVNAAIDSRW